MKNLGEVVDFRWSSVRLGYEIIAFSCSLRLVDDCWGILRWLFRLFCGLCRLIGIK